MSESTKSKWDVSIKIVFEREFHFNETTTRGFIEAEGWDDAERIATNLAWADIENYDKCDEFDELIDCEEVTEDEE
jgi:hypothetical protein